MNDKCWPNGNEVSVGSEIREPLIFQINPCILVLMCHFRLEIENLRSKY